jgi:hypothetical protein
MASQTSMNPWRAEGVSIIPENLADLIPLVGQAELFRRLCSFRDKILAQRSQADQLTGFFTLVGGWGLGKSRVGHEVCLESLDDRVGWVIDGRQERLLQPGLAEGILPLFVRYSQVTEGPYGKGLERENWIPSVAAEGLARLAGLRGAAEAGGLARNQERLLELTRRALRPKGWERALPVLRTALQAASPAASVREALKALKPLGMHHLWLVVDEIEDITDIETDGLRGDRKPIDQALLTVIPRVVKNDEVRQDFPELNFLLLCSQAVGDTLRGIRAIERRSTLFPLTANSFADVDAFFRFLRDHRQQVFAGMQSYPAGLKEAAFFAANRNFGWFNVIMHHAHANVRGGAVAVPDLLRKFAEEAPAGTKGSVFDLDAVSDYWIPRDADRDPIIRALFGLLPRPIGTGAGQVPPAEADRFLAKTHTGVNRPLFTRAVEVAPPPPHVIAAHLVSCGFENPEGTWLQRPGEERFNLQAVMDSLRAYSLGLPADRRDHLLICEREEEFVAQVRALAPQAEEAQHFAPPLHGLLLLPQYRAPGGATYLAPAFSFLPHFHRLNKLGRADAGYLRDSGKNTALREACERIKNDPQARTRALLRGLALAWEQAWDSPTLPAFDPVEDLQLPAYRSASDKVPLALAADGQVTWLLADSAAEPELTKDLPRLGREPAHPVVMVVRRGEAFADELRERVKRVGPSVAPRVIVHAVGDYEAELLTALGLLGEAFSTDDLWTSKFTGGVGLARQRLGHAAKAWRDALEEQGLILRPIFPGRAAKDDELRSLARGYVAVLGGSSIDEVKRDAASVFPDETDRNLELFEKGVRRHIDPGLKYADYPTLGLFADDAGNVTALVPRALPALVELCGSVALPRAEIEKRFFFEVPEDVKPGEVVRQAVIFLGHLGLLEAETENKYRRASVLGLGKKCDGTRDWLDGEYKTLAKAVRKVHKEPGERLLDQHAKEAQQRLREARTKLQSVSLEFLGTGWAELNKTGSDGSPVYVGRFRAALLAVAATLDAVRWVYDPDAAPAFEYSADSLADFEARAAQATYPLWRRVKVLHGFSQEVAERRTRLTKRIDELSQDSDRRVPDGASGEKVFPTQALGLPLKLYREELDFSAETPQKTVAGWGTSLLTATVGFKLHSGKYQEALDRLTEIETQLKLPGTNGLAARYLKALEAWERLVKEYDQVADRLAGLERFFADAPEGVPDQFGMADLTNRAQTLKGLAQDGDIRSGVDDAEAAGHPPLKLIEFLEKDVEKASPQPAALLSDLDTVGRDVLVTLKEEYNDEYKALFNAFSRVRRARLQPLVSWPEGLADTYQASRDLFDGVVQTAEREGTAYLPKGGKVTFEDLIGLCEVELNGGEIDWEDGRYKQMVPHLMEKRLVKLGLI